MTSLNKVTLIGRLGNDPVVRYNPNGFSIANFSLATTYSWLDKQTGERKEDTEWHRVVSFGALNEVVEKYLKKGTLVYVEGRLKTRKWQDKDGRDNYTTEVVMENMQMLSPKSSSTSEEDKATGDEGFSPEDDEDLPPF